MLNSINLHDSQKFYEVTHLGKHYQCSRVSDVIEQTSATPLALKMWLVNCAVEMLHGKNTAKTDIAVLKRLAWQAHEVKQQQALDIGTNVHLMVKRGALDETTQCEETRACWRSFVKFSNDFIPVPIAQELALYDITNLIAGTTDWIGILAAYPGNKKDKKTIHILDWKTSKAINDNYKLQIVIYKHMIELLIKAFKKNPNQFSVANQKILNDIILAAGTKPKLKCAIVRFNKNPNARKLYEFVELTAKEEKHYLKEFKLIVKLFNLRKEKV